ncbi:MAG: recombinase family protein [Methanobacteriota archaeon]|nr:MAG: recombinase family protein [Euryarchaeota archaeon]
MSLLKFGYVRVSREDQNADNQVQLILKEGVKRSNIYIDHLSGITVNKDRPGFAELLHGLKGKEATLYVFEISRIGRSFLDTLSTIQDLESRGIRIWSLSPAESWSRIEDRKLRDLMLSIFSWVADRERESLIERTKLGIARAKSEGKILGRPERKLPIAKIKEYREKGISIAAISRILDIPYSTLIRKWKDTDGGGS